MDVIGLRNLFLAQSRCRERMPICKILPHAVISKFYMSNMHVMRIKGGHVAQWRGGTNVELNYLCFFDATVLPIACKLPKIAPVSVQVILTMLFGGGRCWLDEVVATSFAEGIATMLTICNGVGVGWVQVVDGICCEEG